MSDCYYDVSNEALENITAVYDLIWPISIGLWNLRCSVNGIKHEMPNVTEKQLAAKFSEGSNIHGVNFKRNFMEKTWDEQQSDLALMLLNNTIPIYEGWIDALLQKGFPIYNPDTQAQQFRQLANTLQFPNRVRNGITRLVGTESTLMKSNFYPKYRDKKKRSVGNIENLLRCYRVYKEMRNCCMHKGKIASQVLVDAFTEYTANITVASDLGIKELPQFTAPVQGSPVELGLRCAVTLGEIVLKLIVSIDAELVRADRAEVVFCNRISSSLIVGKKLSADASKANRQIKNYMTTVLGLPVPISSDDIKNYLIGQGFVTQEI